VRIQLISSLRSGSDSVLIQVSWSTLTPYRLVTTGSDGFARVWDIRDACLKRYVAMVGKRPEYKLKLTASEENEEKTKEKSSQSKGQSSANTSESLLPPLPMRDGSTVDSQASLVGSPQAASRSHANGLPRAASQERIVVPPLPFALPPLPGVPVAAAGGNNPGAHNQGAQNNANQQEIAPPGQFVANDVLDEGVKLLKKYKHGATGEDVAGPGTRSKRAAVNVICVARCPFGGHFTTGSDDGICRVWREQEDTRVAIVDRRYSRNGQSGKRRPVHQVSPIDNGTFSTLLLRVLQHSE
jgi:WD40 repeat protein